MAKEIKSSNPFLDDDEVDDYEFLNHPRQGQSGYMLEDDSGKETSDWESKRMQLLEERRRIEERTLLSTNKSLGLLHESEQVGILTAEELLKQREQLHNIEENLDTINNTMRTSQKHINSIKSIFGGIKNYFSKGSTADPVAKPPPEVIPSKKLPSNLQGTVGEMRIDSKESENSHPAFRVRDLPYVDNEFFNEEVSEEQVISPTASSRFANDVDGKIDQNIDHLAFGLGRLKNLAIGLNEEIEQQNDMIDAIHNKADKADETLEYQNRQIKRILKK